MATVSPEGFLALVGDPQRWQILRALAASDRRVGELTAVTGKPQSLVSYHLAQLRDAGLVSGRRSSADGRDTYYRVDLARCGELFGRAASELHPGVRLDVAPASPATHRGRRRRVLFLCTGNSARSQMAEALLEVRTAGAVEARSAGSHPKPLHPNAVRVMAERGVDIGDRRSKHVSRFARTRFDRVVTLCDKVKEVCPELPGDPTTAHWSMADPSAAAADDAGSYPAFVAIADELEARIGVLVADLTATTTREERA